MNSWITEIETPTRQDVLNVCAILAQPMARDVRGGQRFKVTIDGDFSNGKAAIVDAMTASLADGMDVLNLPETSLYETSDCEAHGSKLARDFKSAARNITNTFYHFDHNMAVIDEPEGGAPVNGGVDFETYLCMLKQADPGMRIQFHYGEEYPAKEWSRKWIIEITDPAMQTPEMAASLQKVSKIYGEIGVKPSAQAQLGRDAEI
jgi:hypothetical protein